MATTLDSLRRQARTKLNEMYALITPAAPLVAPQGTPGAKTYTYVVVARNSAGTSIASQPTTITNGATTLNGTNYNQLNWQVVLGAASYDVYRTASNGTPATTGLIANTSSTTLNDTGLAGDSSTAPTINTSGITTPFWSDDELLEYLILGCKDLWRSIIDLHQGHFVTVLDDASVVYPANSATLTTDFTGVPADCFRVLMIEPFHLGDADPLQRWTYFKPKAFNSQQFQAARATRLQDPNQSLIVYYDLMNPGSPVQAPRIVGAPPVSSDLPVRLEYVYTLPTLLYTDNNPIPGESDNALIAWTVAWARAKERDDRSPDPAWVAVYATDKQALLTALTPRQEQEEEVVEGLFDGLQEDW